MNNYYFIVDTSYIIYYSANSAFSQYVRDCDISSKEFSPNFDPCLDPEYVYLFQQKFKRCIERPIQKIIPFIDKSRYIFCLDCARKNIWRRQVFPEYKLQRDLKDKSKDAFNIGTSFKYAKEKIIPEVCAQFGASIIECTYAEGDDCVAITSDYILNNKKNSKVIIISCDKDMVQLYNDRITIITSQGIIRKPKEEIEKSLKIKIDHDISSEDFLLWKIILGDKSDNIPNIKTGIGGKKAFKLLEDREGLKNLIKSDINIAKAFKRNKELISMKLIPENVKELIVESIQTELNKDKVQKKEVNLNKDLDSLLDEL